MSIRATVRRLEQALRPAGLTARWLSVLRDVDRITGGAASEETLRQWAREAAATGRDPGDMLAAILIANARGRAA